MPVGVRRRRPGEGGKPFKIVALVGGRAVGSVEGQSDTRRDAEASARIRNEESRKSAAAGPPIVLSALAKQARKVEGGASFPPEAFAFVPDREKPSTWKLRLWETPQRRETRAQVARAVQAISPSGFRGQRVQLPAGALPAVRRRILRAWLKVNPGADRSEAPAALRRSLGAFGTLSRALTVEPMAKFAARTSRDRGHDHAVELPDEPRAGTFVTRPARTPGARETHVHVLTVRPGSREGQVVVSSPGVDGHAHRIRLGEGRTMRRSADAKAMDAAPGGSAAPLQRESVERKKRKRQALALSPTARMGDKRAGKRKYS